MYRQVQQVRDRMVNLQRILRAGILADSTREMSAFASEGMALMDQMIATLKGAVEHAEPGEGRVDRHLVDATSRALNQAWNRAEKVAADTSVETMRASLVDCKSYADFASAYIAAAMGTEFEL